MRFVTADDSRIMQQELFQRLTELGHEVIAQPRSGLDAVKDCERLHPDVVILDIMMPPFNGDQAGKIIHERKLADHIIFATSQGQQNAVDLANRLGAQLIIKRFTKEKLAAAIAKL